MADNADFLRAIIERPDDDTVRLVYADWLDDHGDPDRAEFIRVQCELPHLPDTDPRRGPLEVRERQLLAKHAAAWIAPREFRTDRAWSVFRRGFVESAWPSDPAMFEAHPIRNLFVGQMIDRIEELTERFGPRIELLYVSDLALDEEPRNVLRRYGARLLELLRSGRFPRLKSVSIERSFVSDAEMDDLLRSGCLRSLEDLILLPTPESIRAALAADLPNVRTLEISGGTSLPYREALAAIVRSPLWSRVEHLSVGPVGLPGPFLKRRGRHPGEPRSVRGTVSRGGRRNLHTLFVHPLRTVRLYS